MFRALSTLTVMFHGLKLGTSLALVNLEGTTKFGEMTPAPQLRRQSSLISGLTPSEASILAFQSEYTVRTILGHSLVHDICALRRALKADQQAFHRCEDACGVAGMSIVLQRLEEHAEPPM